LKPSIVSLGEVLWDLFPEGARFGGAPANFACHAALLGCDVAMLSAVGADSRGREAVDILRGYGIDTTMIQRLEDVPTGTVGVSLDAGGKPTFVIHEGSAWDRIAWTPGLETRIAEADAVYFGSLGQRGEVSRGTIRRALEMAAASNTLRILDINLRSPYYDDPLILQSVEACSVLKLSDDELKSVTRACRIDAGGGAEAPLRSLLERFNLDLVVMTRGAEGAVVVTAAETIEQPGIPTTVRDTVGAGDAFTAALAAGLLRGEALPTIARNACEVAATVCSQPGAVPEYPGAAEGGSPTDATAGT